MWVGISQSIRHLRGISFNIVSFRIKRCSLQSMCGFVATSFTRGENISKMIFIIFIGKNIAWFYV
jgi:hypothetical protein